MRPTPFNFLFQQSTHPSIPVSRPQTFTTLRTLFFRKQPRFAAPNLCHPFVVVSSLCDGNIPVSYNNSVSQRQFVSQHHICFIVTSMSRDKTSVMITSLCNDNNHVSRWNSYAMATIITNKNSWVTSEKGRVIICNYNTREIYFHPSGTNFSCPKNKYKLVSFWHKGNK